MPRVAYNTPLIGGCVQDMSNTRARHIGANHIHNRNTVGNAGTDAGLQRVVHTHTAFAVRIRHNDNARHAGTAAGVYVFTMSWTDARY